MTEQLHDLLTRIADQAGPGSSDPTLWGRARRARRRERVLRASAAALTAVALVGAVAIGVNTRSAPPPTDRHPTAPHKGIPSTVRGIQGDGGLALETDLAVGPASVAIANQSGAFVITAADGVYHRLRLPGFDPTAFDGDQPGLALSPDGTRLAYGWRARERVGTRVLDLRTGRLRTLPEGPPDVHDLPAVRTNGYGWSPDGRYLVFGIVLKDEGTTTMYAGFDTATPGATYRVGGEQSPKSHYFFWTAESRFASCGLCPRLTVLTPQLLARVRDSSVLFAHVAPGTISSMSVEFPGNADWSVGRFAPDGRRLLVQPLGVGPGLVLVSDGSRRRQPFTNRRNTATLLRLDPADWPAGAKIDVLGWVGPDHALALVRRGTGPDTWEPVGKLALVDLGSVASTSAGETRVHLDVVGEVEPGETADTYSFATDLATVDAPTQDFDDPSSPSRTADPSSTGALTSQNHSDGGTARPMAYAAGLSFLAGMTFLVARQRRNATSRSREL